MPAPGLIVAFEPATFCVDLKPGKYKITLVFGDTLFDNHETHLSCKELKEDLKLVKGNLGEYTTITFCVDLIESPLEIQFDSPTNNWIINYVCLEETEELATTSISTTYFPIDLWPKTNFVLEEALKQLESQSAALDEETGIKRTDYLSVVRSIVGYFLPWQIPNGSIIDPFLGVEYQYATPAFAYSTLLLAREDVNPILFQFGVLALNYAIQALASRSAASGHEDFYPFLIAHSLNICKDQVPPELFASWSAHLSSTDPFSLYRVRPGGHDGAGSNWNCKSLSGEFLFYKLGFRASPAYTEASLSRQGRFFDNPFGMYGEGPIVYDIFPRCWLADTIEAGFRGHSADKLDRTLRQGAITSLKLQMPDGSLVSGGRSSHHLWADALQVLCFEIESRRYKDKDIKIAGVFKRAARRAYKSVKTWQRKTGELQVVRNRTEPEYRHGFENYSSHSQYNLLAAFILGLAFEYAEVSESIPERFTPAETGGYILDLPKPFSRVVVNCGGGSNELGRSGRPATTSNRHIGRTVLRNSNALRHS